MQDTMTPPYRITIGNDSDGEDPHDYGIFELKQWNSSLVHEADPEQTIGCTYEPDDEAYTDEFGYEPCNGFEWWKIHTEPETPFYHEYAPPQPIITWLKYFEHGSSRWMRQDAYFPFDPGDWDTSKHAGVLILNSDGEKEWPNMTEEQRESAIDTFLQCYTAWGNGEVYWIRLDKLVEPTSCDCCKQRTNEDWETVDSMGGILDHDGEQVRNYIKEWLQAEGIENPQEDEDYKLVESYG